VLPIDYGPAADPHDPVAEPLVESVWIEPMAERVVEGFFAAWERADVDAIVSMLTEDAVLAVPPEPTWFAGRDAVSDFLATVPLAATTPRHRLVSTWANGQLAFGHYSWREEPNAFVRHAITVLTLRDAEIAQITFFRSTNAFTGFDLPEQIGP
jgi:ketosteroid isomerase-like protein